MFSRRLIGSVLRPTYAQCRRMATAPVGALSRTGLYDFHIQNGAKMVEFAGYEMPLAYGDIGQVASHHHVRNSAGLFDVGHMVQTNFRGPTATAFLEWLTPSSLSTLGAYSSTLSVLLNETGGIIDDTIITKHSPGAYYVVTNAGRRTEDLAWFNARLTEWNEGPLAKEKGPVEMEILEGWGLVALQGPKAASTLQNLTSFDLRGLKFGRSAYVPLDGGSTLHVARGGYTGEDGFEISIPPQQTEEVATMLAKDPVMLVGLGARDSLRLEAGMCLYGSDLDESISPIEGALAWVIGKDRREKLDFIGGETVGKHLKQGPPRRRVGMIVDGAPARHGAKIFLPGTDELLGEVTSGIPSPTLGKNIAMGYVKNGNHKKGTAVEVEVRDKRRTATLTPMPFVPTNYWRG
ncbi:glycine cleavage system T protein [Cylindrobasidium torrendii FP15055 ss-10]|uniref:Aminomethyltransferase n=1 Tax=Cylindrobasidium torrendii FP15055 ss-10 TaxID=1314674 RepID=A0A0D7BMF4_9AGAR|nr:glycine cleavage system T protein [Cylindrobasidium torrendii FP15055 ss-10]